MQLNFPGIIAGELLVELDKSLVFEAFIKDQRKSVLLKMLRHDYPDPMDIRRTFAEVQFHRTLQLPSLPPLVEVRSHQRGPVLLLARPAGSLLPAILEAGTLDLHRFLRLAVSITQAVADLHGASIIHRGLNPQILLCDEPSAQTFFLDLSSASRLSRMNREIEKTVPMTGNLAFIAPEQTGRINRSVDHRTDLYALGLIFYQMLTGRHPFQAHSPAEWAHNHIARMPPAIERSDVPPIVTSIIMRLLSKNAEDRYQSAAGLQGDLQRCAASLLRDGQIENFEIAQRDSSAALQISEKLYGRGAEMDILNRAFEASRTGPLQMVLVTGAPGVGKTALIGELQKRIAELKGLFVEGKFEQYERHVPYRAWITASQRLIDRTDSESTSHLERTKDKIKQSLGTTLGVITHALPALEKWFGKQQQPAELPPAESRNRFTDSFVNFAASFDQEERPLVIFLDDVQWADAGSLELLRSFYSIAADARLLIILACRDSDMASLTAFSSVLEDLKKQKTFRIVQMPPLQREDVGQMIADSLLLSPDRTAQLAEWIHQQTEGTPLYVTQLLHSLQQEGTLRYDAAAARWLWNESRLRELSDNVDLAEFLARKIDGLGNSAREVLSAASCLGNRFDFALLCACCGLTQEDAKAGLSAALHEGLLIASETRKASPEGFDYQFSHDRVQQASYQLCSEEKRQRIHLAAARHMKGAADDGEQIFSLVEHLNQARSLIRSTDERYEAARMNLLATRAAKANAAWTVALNCSLSAIDFLPPDSWKEDYRLSYSVYREALESEYLNGNYTRAEELFRTLSRQTRDSLELVRIYEQLVVLYTNMGRHEEGIDLGLRGLAMIGIKVPRRPGTLSVLREVLRVTLKRGRKTADDILRLPEVQDERLKAALDLLMAVTPCAFFTNQNLFALIALRMTYLSLKHGNSRVSAYGYITYAILLLDVFKKPHEAVSFGQMALRLNDRFDNQSIRAKLGVIYGAFLNHWDGPLHRSVSYLKRAFRAGLETGDLVYAGYALANRIFATVIRGENLEECDRQAHTFLRFTERTGDRDVEGDFRLTLQATAHLQGHTKDDLSFSDEHYDEQAHVREMQKGNPVTLCWYYFLRLRNLYLTGESEMALAAADELEKIVEPARPLTIGPAFLFFRGMAILDLKEKGRATASMLRKLGGIMKTYEGWARTLEAPHMHKRLALLRAEARAITGHPGALADFSRAMQLAAQDEDLLLRALAAERAGRHCHRIGAAEAADHYISDSLYYYSLFGADRKLHHLRSEFPSAQMRRSESHQSDSTDVLAITRTAIAISSEIVQSKLIERMLETILVQAGARRIAYIHHHDGRLCMAAVGNADPEIKVEMTHEAAVNVDFLPPLLLHRVLSSLEPIILNDASLDDSFGLAERPVKSVMCLPLLVKGTAAGLLYLDNDLATGIFTEEKLRFLSVLTSQFAVSLENSTLYANLEGRVQERTAELEQSLEQVRTLKLSQDLDYYLTSLLLQPLSGIRVSDTALSIQEHVLQKKKFKYMRWEDQLGGDLCIARTVQIAGRRCIAVANADAMGKSMQGAGGALVFGAVFESITASSNEDVGPEQWLRNCYAELNEVFRSFSGYMMISAVIALIDEHSNTIFYLNSDHPSPVLVRNGKGSFLSPGVLPRFGMRPTPAEIPVEVLHVEPGDVFICATDGRDDLIVTDGAGQPALNEDPDLFLRNCEEAGGDAEVIFRTLTAGDRLTDDLAILSVRFPGIGETANAAANHSAAATPGQK